MMKCNNCDSSIKDDYTVISTTVSEQIYCKDCYNELFTSSDNTCHYCENFTYKRGKYGYLQPRFILPNGEEGLLGECEKHNKTVTTHSKSCKDYKYAFKDPEPYCSKEHIIKDCALNDNCKRADYDCSKCFTKDFWENDVLRRREKHVIGNKWSDGQIGVDSFTTGEGGYYNARFDIHFDDGEILEDVGLWSRGRVPNKRVYKLIRHGEIIRRRD